MFLLQAAETLSGVAAAATTVTVHIYGLEAGTTTDTYKRVYQGQLPSSVGTLYTVPASTSTLVKKIIAVNTGSSTTFSLYHNGTTDPFALCKAVSLPAGYTFVWDEAGIHVYDTAGTLQQSGWGAASFAVPALVLGTANAAGVATTAIRSDATILAFDATPPAPTGGTAVVGVAPTGARRDHGHVDGIPTTKGDLVTFSTLPIRHGAGADGETAIYDSSTTDGLRNAPFQEAKRSNDLLSWTFDPYLIQTSTTVSAAATLQLLRIPIARQLSVTNVLVNLVTRAGSTLTHCFVALFKSDGTIIGQSADQAAVWQSGGSGSLNLQTLALVGGPFTVIPLAANDFVWAAIYCGTAGGTLPAFSDASAQLSAGLANVGTSAARSRMGLLAQADTATLVSIVPGNIAGGARPFWVAIS